MEDTREVREYCPFRSSPGPALKQRVPIPANIVIPCVRHFVNVSYRHIAELRTLAIGESTLYLVQPGDDTSDLTSVPLTNIVSLTRKNNPHEMFGAADLDLFTKKMPGAKDATNFFAGGSEDAADRVNKKSQLIEVHYISSRRTKDTNRDEELSKIELVAYERPSSVFYHLHSAWLNAILRRTLRQPLDFALANDSKELKSKSTMFHQILREIINEKDIPHNIELLAELSEAVYFDREIKSLFACSDALVTFMMSALDRWRRTEQERRLSADELRHTHQLLLTIQSALFNSQCVKNRSSLLRIVSHRHSLGSTLRLLLSDFCGLRSTGGFSHESLPQNRRQWWIHITDAQVAVLIDLMSIEEWAHIQSIERGNVGDSSNRTSASASGEDSTMISTVLCETEWGRYFVKSLVDYLANIVGEPEKTTTKERSRAVRVWRICHLLSKLSEENRTSWVHIVEDSIDVFRTKRLGEPHRCVKGFRSHWTSSIFHDLIVEAFEAFLRPTVFELSSSKDMSETSSVKDVGRVKRLGREVRTDRRRRRSSVTGGIVRRLSSVWAHRMSPGLS